MPSKRRTIYALELIEWEIDVAETPDGERMAVDRRRMRALYTGSTFTQEQASKRYELAHDAIQARDAE